MFCFLIDPTGWVEIAGEAFAPGFFVWNSEVGRRSVGILTFWFQSVCANHIVWDATEVVEYARRHTGKADNAFTEIRRIIESLVAKRDSRKDAFAAVVASRPHYELAFSGLTDHELAQVCKALSEADIPFEQSQPPGPFIVYVDRAERSAAYMAVYGAGALDKPLEGILAAGGVASVFESAEERAQGVRKREWQEMVDVFRALLTDFDVPTAEQNELVEIVESTKDDIVATPSP